MLSGIAERFSVWGDVLTPSRKWLVLAPLTVLGVAQSIREVWVDRHPQETPPPLLNWLPSWPLWLWITVVSVVVGLLLLEGAYRTVKNREEKGDEKLRDFIKTVGPKPPVIIEGGKGGEGGLAGGGGGAAAGGQGGKGGDVINIPAPHIEQDKPVYSPNVVGDHNIVTFGETPPLEQRTLSDEQKAKFLDALRASKPDRIILIAWPSRESQRYLVDFSDVLKQAEWHVQHLILGGRPQPYAKIRAGYRGDAPNQAFRVFSNALAAAGIDSEGTGFDSTTEESVSLDVGVVPASDRQIVFDKLD